MNFYNFASVLPYYAVIFRSLRTKGDDNNYNETSKQMKALAEKQAGFMGIESYRNEEGAGVTISYWKDLESIKIGNKIQSTWKPEKRP